MRYLQLDLSTAISEHGSATLRRNAPKNSILAAVPHAGMVAALAAMQATQAGQSRHRSSGRDRHNIHVAALRLQGVDFALRLGIATSRRADWTSLCANAGDRCRYDDGIEVGYMHVVQAVNVWRQLAIRLIYCSRGCCWSETGRYMAPAL